MKQLILPTSLTLKRASRVGRDDLEALALDPEARGVGVVNVALQRTDRLRNWGVARRSAKGAAKKRRHEALSLFF